MRQMNQIIIAMLAMSGRVTMLGISRWAGKGGSYRTVICHKLRLQGSCQGGFRRSLEEKLVSASLFFFPRVQRLT